MSFSSHAIDRGTIAVIVYFIHEVAAALWIGALAALMAPIPLYAWGVSSARIEDSAGVAATS